MNMQFLPLGTVVRVKDAQPLFVLTGYQVNNGKNEIKDYCAVRAPLGQLNRTDIYLFNADVIEEVVFEGYQSSEYQKLTALIEEKTRKQAAGK